MNVADSEVVVSILAGEGYTVTGKMPDADLILVNTCSVRENAEQRVRGRLDVFRIEKKKRPELLIGVIGCMAERLKEQLLYEERVLDFIAGPDAYRSLPELIDKATIGQTGFDLLLSEKETYDDIDPVRYDNNGVSAFISIMRGCNNFCSYCVVPYTRGRERSRNPKTILDEMQKLIYQGYKEGTLLGQNVNSYRWQEGETVTDFADLIEQAALLSPDLRIRFATSHPKDVSDKLIETIATHANICKHIHLPLQSGSDSVLQRMNRVYTRAYYLERIAAIKKVLPDCAVSTDIIAGFCGETEEDHADTLSIMSEVGYSSAFMFKYSVREGTKAAEKFEDDVPDEIKARRLEEIIALQQKLSLQSNRQDVGKIVTVLVEGVSKRSKEKLFGRTDQNKACIFPKAQYKTGDYVNVRITGCTAHTLFAELSLGK